MVYSPYLQTLLVRYYNDLLGIQASERGRDEDTFFYVGDLFCIHLGPKYANFQEKNLCAKQVNVVPY